MAALIVSICFISILVTVLVVNGTIRSIEITDRSEQMDRIESRLLAFYEENDEDWGTEKDWAVVKNDPFMQAAGSFLVQTADGDRLLAGKQKEGVILSLGLKRDLYWDDAKIGSLFYYDPEAAGVRKIQLGVGSSVTVILVGFTLVLLLVSLIAAYLVARRVTAPLRLLLPAIERLGSGGLGTQAPVLSRDEYGKVASTFNEMSVRLLRAEQARRSLVADVAHELRTPLSILQGQMDLFQQRGGAIETYKLLPLQDELIRLGRLVDDLQLLSLAEARQLQLRMTVCPVSDLLARVADRFAEDAAGKALRIELIDRTGQPSIPLDEHRMTQVLFNLVGNAVRYTPHGGLVAITTEIERTAEQEGGRRRWLTIRIADSGPGIGAEHLPHIFDRFYRTDEARARTSGGMGLGLAIAKELVLAHGGSIEAQSVVGQGTTMIVRLPFEE
nr:ATP-binding protein [Paenibacillus soyae]